MFMCPDNIRYLYNIITFALVFIPSERDHLRHTHKIISLKPLLKDELLGLITLSVRDLMRLLWTTWSI